MRYSKRRGMTPAELLVALLAVVALSFLFYHWVNIRAESEKRNVTIERMLEIETALQKYCADCAGALPTEKQTLSALHARPTVGSVPRGWAGPYVSSPDTINDAWGRRFKYFCPGKSYEESTIPRAFDLASYGRDGREGGKGLDRDICNWDRKTMSP